MKNGYKELREEFIENLRKDLIGPYEENEVLHESPTSTYIMGRLSPITENVQIEEEAEDSVFEENQEETEFESIELSEVLHPSKNKQSSAGLKIFLAQETVEVLARVKWADYIVVQTTAQESGTRKYQRVAKELTKKINIKKGNIQGELIENDIYVSWMTHGLRNQNKMVSVYVENRRKQEEINDPTKHIYQVELILESTSNDEIFLSESFAYSKNEEDDFFYNKKPIFSRGYGCAAIWESVVGQTAKIIRTSFLPSKEINGVEAEIKKFQGYFSMQTYSEFNNKKKIIEELLDFLDDYKIWIEGLRAHEYMKNEHYQDAGNKKIEACLENWKRMKKGINILQTNDNAFQSFIYMNKALHLSRSMGEYSKKHTENQSIDNYKYNHSFWRPFQIGFVLLNIEGIVSPNTSDRDILDLLYFPTGGGKTEAYLGVISFLLFHRRITRKDTLNFEKDGGVTVIVRYTLRLLTTQQRDRMLRLIAACEILRNEDVKKFGDQEFSIGFWVGGTVTVNKYSELIVNSSYNPYHKVDSKIRNLKGQILKCPCCGFQIEDGSYKLDIDKKQFEVFCSNKTCYFNESHIPVYLIDEDIYKKAPTVIIGTVDKFARITFEEKTSLLFGKRKLECSQCGSMLDEEAISSCIKQGHKSQGKQKEVLPFYPPELILQDELHLITGPLGTIYGGYEMAINEMSKIHDQEKVISPKYIASTATIKNAGKQITSLYARAKFNMFPSSGHDSGDSYFAVEKGIDEYPFREYIGVSSPYTSMKTIITRVYAVLLQTAERYKDHPVYKDFLDPYWTLVGYYNSKRELGGAVRLIQDDIPARTLILKKKNNDKWPRKNLIHDEITSRKRSREIPIVLEKLETPIGGKYPYDVVVATNMIQVGMDVERLGLMSVTGQPKTTAEYIQATSRIGRKTPGLVVTVYNAYRSRDLSHYENFTTYHSHLYRYVEGNSATPFSARARERSLHSALIALLRNKHDQLSDIKFGARAIEKLSKKDLDDILQIIRERIAIVDPNNLESSLQDIRYFIDEWITLARKNKNLYYHVSSSNKGYKMKKNQRLLKFFGENGANYEKPTLNSMRNVQKEVGLYLWEE